MLYNFFHSVLIEMFLFVREFGNGELFKVSGMFIISSAFAIGYWLFCYLFMGFGLYTMAKRRNMKIAYLAFIPFGSDYLMGELVGEINLFGWKTKRLGLVVMIIELVAFALTLTQDFMYLQVLLKFWNSNLSLDTGVQLYGDLVLELPVGAEGYLNTRRMSVYFVGLAKNLVGMISGIAYLVLLMYLFRNYAPKSCFLFLVLSILIEFLGPILVFVIRKNSCEEYREFMRMKMHSMYGGGNPYQYGDGTYRDPYDLSGNGNGSRNGQTPPDSPFGEYDDKK